MAEKFRARFGCASQWRIPAWIAFLANRRRTKKRFHYCFNANSSKFSCSSEHSRDIQEVFSLIQHCKTMYCCRMTSPSTSTISGTLRHALRHTTPTNQPTHITAAQPRTQQHHSKITEEEKRAERGCQGR